MNPINGENCYEGDLISVNDDKIVIEIKIKTRRKRIEINKNNIDECRLSIKF
ncbi:MAG TPA: hypothetical protein DEA28_04190 [Firmicutes bacterium]|nr:hypothetical protein [Bacillota bacterium]